MTFYLAGLPAIELFLIIFGSSIILTVLGLVLVQRYFNRRKPHRTGVKFVTSFFTIIGALLGVLLTMVLVTIWQNYQKEKENVISEVSNYVNFYGDAEGLDKEECLEIRAMVREIVKLIISDSWPRMERGEEGVKALVPFNSLFNKVRKIVPKSFGQELAKENLIKSLKTAADLRKNRVLKVTQSAIPEVMWGVISLCAIISVSCGFFFRISPFWIHILLTILHSGMISVIIFLIISLMYPYRGSTHVTPEPFQKLLTVTFPKIDKEYSAGMNATSNIIIPK